MDCVGWKIITDATTEPVSAAEMKVYLRIASTDTTYDTQLAAQIKAARKYLERVSKRAVLTQTIEARYSKLSREIVLPITPAQSITSVKYNVNGTENTLDVDSYELWTHGTFPQIRAKYLVTYPFYADPDSVLARYIAGNTVADEVAKAIVLAMVADLFEHPEANVELTLNQNRTIERAIDSYRTSI